jgi:hypothetical protein
LKSPSGIGNGSHVNNCFDVDLEETNKRTETPFWSKSFEHTGREKINFSTCEPKNIDKVCSLFTENVYLLPLNVFYLTLKFK